MKHPTKLARDTLANSLLWTGAATSVIALCDAALVVPRLGWVALALWVTYLVAAVPFVVVGYKHERDMAAFTTYREALAANEKEGETNNAAPQFQRDRQPEFVG